MKKDDRVHANRMYRILNNTFETNYWDRYKYFLPIHGGYFHVVDGYVVDNLGNACPDCPDIIQMEIENLDTGKKEDIHKICMEDIK